MEHLQKEETMKNGKCPKCGAATVHTLSGGTSFGNIDKIYVNGPKFHQPSSYTTYVCVSCGYFENYLSGSYLPEIVKSWPKVPFKG
jgi:hypothetical protein